MSLTKLSLAGIKKIFPGQCEFDKWHPGWGRENHYITRNLLPKIITILQSTFTLFFFYLLKTQLSAATPPWWPPFFCFSAIQNLQLRSVRPPSTWKNRDTAVYMLHNYYYNTNLFARWVLILLLLPFTRLLVHSTYFFFYWAYFFYSVRYLKGAVLPDKRMDWKGIVGYACFGTAKYLQYFLRHIKVYR